MRSIAAEACSWLTIWRASEAQLRARQPGSLPMTPPIQAAGFARRIGAMVYDGLLLIAIWMMTLFPIVALTNNAASGAMVQSLLFGELVAFFVFFWYFRGQTLGMLAWHLELRTCTGHALTPVQLVIRVFASMFSLLCFGLGYLWILIDPQRRSWGDMISQTMIVYVPDA